jgi:hypothetical protein
MASRSSPGTLCRDTQDSRGATALARPCASPKRRLHLTSKLLTTPPPQQQPHPRSQAPPTAHQRRPQPERPPRPQHRPQRPRTPETHRKPGKARNYLSHGLRCGRPCLYPAARFRSLAAITRVQRHRPPYRGHGLAPRAWRADRQIPQVGEFGPANGPGQRFSADRLRCTWFR